MQTPSEEHLNASDKVLLALKGPARYSRVDGEGKPYFGWTYALVSIDSDREPVIDILRKLAHSTGRGKEILFAPSKQNENSLVVLSPNNETMQACAISVQSALVQLQTLIAEQNGIRVQIAIAPEPETADPYKLNGIYAAYAERKSREQSSETEATKAESGKDEEKPTAEKTEPKGKAAKIKEEKPKKRPVQSTNFELVRNVAANCRDIYNGGSSITLPLPPNVPSFNAVKHLSWAIASCSLTGVKCEAGKNGNAITITASTENDLQNALANLACFSPSKEPREDMILA